MAPIILSTPFVWLRIEGMGQMMFFKPFFLKPGVLQNKKKTIKLRMTCIVPGSRAHPHFDVCLRYGFIQCARCILKQSGDGVHLYTMR